MSRTRHDTPGTDRDAVLMALIVAAISVLAAIAALLIVAMVTTTGLHTGRWAWPDFPHWAPLAVSIAADLGDPGRQLPLPWSQGLTDHVVTFYVLFSVVALLLASVTVGVSVPVWRRVGPSAAGHASRRDLRRALSPAAARTTAKWTRPDLTDHDRREAPLEQISVPLHLGPNRQTLVTSLESPTGVVAPTRSGKSRTDLVHKVLAAPGALFASTTKDDLAEWGLLARTRRPNAGPVWLLDVTNTVSWPAKVRWSPVTGCHDTAVALRRAETLIEASSLGLRDVGGNDKVFRGRAAIVLQAYLLAAALHGRTVVDLVNWSISKPPDQEPVELLRREHPEMAFNLASEIGMVAETSDAVWMSVRRAIEPFMNPDIRTLCTPSPDEEFDIPDFLQQQGSFFLIAGQHQAPQARPVLTALAEQILTTAQDMALHQTGRRLTPPATAILDELYEGTPVPRLPGLIADSAGRGVIIHWSAQSRSQLDELYGESGRRQLLDNTLTLSIYPSLKDDATLEWLSVLCDHHRRRTYQQNNDGMLSSGRTTIGSESVPTYRPGAIRTLDKGRVLILHANLRPILGRTVDVEKRPDWNQLRDDVAAIRAGHVHVTDRGYATTPHLLPTADTEGWSA